MLQSLWFPRLKLFRKSAARLRLWQGLREHLVRRLGQRKKLYVGRLRRLETRQVLSVSATFAGGILDIQLAAGGAESVGLWASGNDFFVDQNNNQTQDVGEVTGLIADIGRLQATSPDQVGTFLWRGDFSRAPLNQSSVFGPVVNLSGFNQIQMLANFNAAGNVQIQGTHEITLGGQVTILGATSIVSQQGAIESDSTAQWRLESTASLTARDTIALAQTATDQFQFLDAAHFKSLQGDVQLGRGANLQLEQLSIDADDAVVHTAGDVALDQLRLTGSLRITADGHISDTASANLRIIDQATLTASTIQLADDVADWIDIGGDTTLRATAGDVQVGPAGTVQLGAITASGNRIQIVEFSDMLLRSIESQQDASLISLGVITDDNAATIRIAGSGIFDGDAIRLGNEASDVLAIDGPAAFIARVGDVEVASLGQVQLGQVDASGRNVTLYEDAELVLRAIDATGDLTLASQAALQDVVGATIAARGRSSLTGTSIVLADNATDRLSLLGACSFTATAGDVTIGAAGSVILGTLSASGRNLSIVEDSDLVLSQINASQLQLGASGSITDTAGANVQVSGDSQLAGTTIVLADQLSERLSLLGNVDLTATRGDVQLGPHGLVTLGTITATGRNLELYEDSDTVIQSLRATSGLYLTSAGTITDLSNSLVNVSGTAAIIGTSITLGDSTGDRIFVGGSIELRANPGDISLGTQGSVVVGQIQAFGRDIEIHEDADTELFEIQATGNLLLTSSGQVRDVVDANIRVAGNASVTAASILLADDAGDLLIIQGENRWQALGGDVTIGPAGRVELGDILASGVNISIQEDADMSLSRIRASGALRLSSTGAITDLPGATIEVDGSANLSAQSVTLADNNQDRLNVIGDFVVRAQPGDVTIGPAGQVTLGQLDIVGGRVFISEDADMDVRYLVSRGNTELESSGALRDTSGATITVAGNGRFTAQQIILADSVGDQLTVNGTAGFFAQDDVFIGAAGLVQLGDVSASARNLVLNEDEDTSLDQIHLRGNLTLVSAGDISDIPAASIDIRGTANMVGRSINLADHASDRLNVLGMVDLRTTADIVIADPGRVTLGTLNARGNNVAIFEDAAMLLNDVRAVQTLRLDSSESIVNLVAVDANRITGVQAQDAIITAGTHVHLGSIDVQRLSGSFHANAVLNQSNLFRLNSQADAVGLAALDVLNEPNAEGLPIPTTWIDGTQLGEMQHLFSYASRFAGQYGFYVSNLSTLQLGNLQGIGDGLHLYVETLGEHDLSIVGDVQIVNTSTVDGAMALVAGRQLSIAQHGVLETVSVSGLARDTERVLVPLLVAAAFDGGEGPPGFESTRSVILERALNADTRGDAVLAGAQNVFQQVSSQFGSTDEAGFLAIIRYADGRTQLFDTYQEVVGSFDGTVGTKGEVGIFQGAIPAHPASNDAAAVIARSIPFTDVFLNGVQELPTLVVYRRSTDFYLFENAGRTDVAVQAIDLNSAEDRVLGVLTNAIPPSFSLPTLIETTTPLLPAPASLFTETVVNIQDNDQELETKIEFDPARQVAIYRVGFDDDNENGQAEDSELPSRDQIVQQQRTTTDQTDRSHNTLTNKPQKLAPGQLDLASRDVQKDLNPTPETLDAWTEQYRNDPRIASGAYTIVQEATRTGIEVLRIFSVRDFNQSAAPADPASTDGNQANEGLAPGNINAPQDQPGEATSEGAQSDDASTDLSGVWTRPELEINGLVPRQETASQLTGALFLTGGLVWLTRQAASRLCQAQLQALANQDVAFDRDSRRQRAQAGSTHFRMRGQ